MVQQFQDVSTEAFVVKHVQLAGSFIYCKIPAYGPPQPYTGSKRNLHRTVTYRDDQLSPTGPVTRTSPTTHGKPSPSGFGDPGDHEVHRTC